MLGRTLFLLLVVGGCCFMAFSQPQTKFLSIGLNSSGDILITKADGKRIGFDAPTKKTFAEIEGATTSTSRDREPMYRVPIGATEKPLKIKVFGREGSKKADLAVTGENFVVRFVGLTLGIGINFTIVISPDGNKIEFSGNVKSIPPTFVFAVDSSDDNQQSYNFKLNRSSLSAKKIVKIALDINGFFAFNDNDKPRASYNLKITRINADGRENDFTAANLTTTITNQFEVDFSKWNGTDGICLRTKTQNKGSKSENCRPLK